MKKLKEVEKSEQQSPDLKKSDINLYCENYKLMIRELPLEENAEPLNTEINSDTLPRGFLSSVFRPPSC
jgi:hypothetical protein